MDVGRLQEMVDDRHAIIYSTLASEQYVSVLSFVDKNLLVPGCSLLLNHKV